MELQNRIKEILEEQEKSQNQLAKYLGLSSGTVSNMINNKNLIDVGTALRMAEFLNVAVDDLFYFNKPNKYTREDLINHINSKLNNYCFYNVNMIIGVPINTSIAYITRIISYINRWLSMFKLTLEIDYSYKVLINDDQNLNDCGKY